MYEIREPAIGDIRAIREMHGRSWRDTYQSDEYGVTEDWLASETAGWLTDESLARSRERLEPVFSDTSQYYRVALRGSEVVGLLHLLTKEDGSKYLGGLYTDKSTHGTGLAQQLVALADEWIGDEAVELEVVSYNAKAIRFYEKNGYVITKENDELFKDRMPVTTMRRGGVSEGVDGRF